ncbi:MAG TPA: SGNH/GDSL hydrolase family protein [Pyrinomonadaceae bacterium]|nr:SGNH/GDSL hydrolase family protein [Pyrinomonadaceae bacterium]
MKTIIIALAMFLVGCAQPAPAKEIRIGFYGDSTAYGTTSDKAGEYSRSANNEPDQLEWLLQARFGNAVFVENRGVPGAICSDFLWGQNDVKRSWRDEMVSSPADIVILNVGLNDAGRMSWDDFNWCMEQAIVIAKANGKRFVIAAPNPVNKHFNDVYWSTVHIEESLALKHNVTLVDHWNGTMNETTGWRDMLPDGIHPNDELYGLKAKRTFNAIAPAVQSMRQK